MSDEEILEIRGVRYLRARTVASWYEVEVTVLERVAELELVEHEHVPGQGLLVPDSELDRIAQILRWRWQTGLELEALVTAAFLRRSR